MASFVRNIFFVVGLGLLTWGLFGYDSRIAMIVVGVLLTGLALCGSIAAHRGGSGNDP